jgi:RNA recognition motif-containing protein
LRAVKFENNKFYSPNFNSNDGWGEIQYFCVFSKKTAAELKPAEESTASGAPEKQQKSSPSSSTDVATAAAVAASSGAQPKTVDLIVLNLSASTSEVELREYFESKFGPLLMVELKRDRKTGSSRRFAFIRFKNYKEQMRALGQAKHKIDGHQARLALPDFRDPSELYQENKCFIGRVNEAIKASDLREYFSQFGDIVEISYPKKFKGYAFITFADADVARKVCGQDFIVKGYSLCVSKSTHGSNKKDSPHQLQNYQQDYSQQDWSNGWFQANPRQDQWTPGQKYVTAPLNPVSGSSNFYGNSVLPPNVNQMNPMVNALSLAMSNMMNNPGYKNVSGILTILITLYLT